MKKIFYTLILFALFSCNENPVETPDNLLDEEVMVDILYDIALLQAADGYVPEKLAINNIKVNTFIYSKYNIDSVTYYQNHKYYAADVKEYKKMYKEVISRIESKTKELEGNTVEESETASGAKPVYIPPAN
jgi:histidinol phosphatase-like PHP family hydrolase